MYIISNTLHDTVFNVVRYPWKNVAAWDSGYDWKQVLYFIMLCFGFFLLGHLILHLTKESYTRLGLEGKPSHYNRYGGEKYGMFTFVYFVYFYSNIDNCRNF